MNQQSLLSLSSVLEILHQLLPDPTTLELDHVVMRAEGLTLVVTSTQPTARCPLCGQTSHRVQSRYVRTLADLPWATRNIRLQLTARRFFCDNAACRRKMFCERLEPVVQVHARRTTRLRDVLLATGWELGGEAGARQCAAWSIRVCGDTLLALLRRCPPAARPTPRIVGVDDFAFGRGQPAGTILVDLEQHVPVDLLAESTEEAFTTWLQEHPGVEVISRDRGQPYAKGAAQGAPQALQVVDRWHLLVRRIGACVDSFQRKEGLRAKDP